MSRESIFAEVAKERERQDNLFGGAAHDDTHTASHWVSILVRHIGLAVDDGSPDGVCLMDDHCAGSDPARFRRQMVRVAAIAIATIETFDRKAAGAELLEWEERAQAMADRYGEPSIAVPAGHPTLEQGARQIPYVCLLSLADAWEKKNAIATRSPRNVRV